MIKVLTIAGTRPELIRLTRMLSQFDSYFDHELFFTGQNTDPNLSTVFFEQLEIRPPKYQGLTTQASSSSQFLSLLFQKIDSVLDAFKPNVIVILGDTNSGLAAIAGKKKGIKIFHLEAGNRCWDESVEEEVNRRILDEISDFNLVYSEIARKNLMAAGQHPSRIFLIGSPLKELYEFHKSRIAERQFCKSLGLEPNNYFLLSWHRGENVGDFAKIEWLFGQLIELSEHFDQTIVFPIHPRTNKIIKENGFLVPDRVLLCEPLPYIEFVSLQIDATCVLSDSGSISEEADIMNLSAVNLRSSQERYEVMEAGVLVMCPPNHGILINAVQMAISLSQNRNPLNSVYQNSDASSRVCALIQSYA